MTLADRIIVMKDAEIQQIGAPLELYERPKNRFVAGFIGSPAMNFLVSDRRPEAGYFSAPGPAVRVGMDMGRPIEGRARRLFSGIRPEHTTSPLPGEPAPDQSQRPWISSSRWGRNIRPPSSEALCGPPRRIGHASGGRWTRPRDGPRAPLRRRHGRSHRLERDLRPLGREIRFPVSAKSVARRRPAFSHFYSFPLRLPPSPEPPDGCPPAFSRPPRRPPSPRSEDPPPRAWPCPLPGGGAFFLEGISFSHRDLPLEAPFTPLASGTTREALDGEVVFFASRKRTSTERKTERIRPTASARGRRHRRPHRVPGENRRDRPLLRAAAQRQVGRGGDRARRPPGTPT